MEACGIIRTKRIITYTMNYYIFNRYGEGTLYTYYCTAVDKVVYDGGGEKQQPLSECIVGVCERVEKSFGRDEKQRLSLLQRRRSISPPPPVYKSS